MWSMGVPTDANLIYISKYLERPGSGELTFFYRMPLCTEKQARAAAYILRMPLCTYGEAGARRRVYFNGRLSFHPIPCGTALIGHVTAGATLHGLQLSRASH